VQLTVKDGLRFLLKLRWTFYLPFETLLHKLALTLLTLCGKIMQATVSSIISIFDSISWDFEAKLAYNQWQLAIS